MNELLIHEYIKKIEEFNDKEYLFSTITYNIAPTIAKQKPSSIITLSKNNRELDKLWHMYKEDFKKECNIDFYELKKNDKSVTILFYDEQILREALFKEENMEFLSRFEYKQNMSVEQCVELLKYRFEKMCPHEMGIFLGIPVEDVVAFMDFPNKECLICGYWKVYHNVDKAKETFFNYDKAKVNVLKGIIEGVKPETLINSYDFKLAMIKDKQIHLNG